jgi:hypothetical protein
MSAASGSLPMWRCTSEAMELANVDGVVVRVEWFTPLLSKMTANTYGCRYLLCVFAFLDLMSGVTLFKVKLIFLRYGHLVS